MECAGIWLLTCVATAGPVASSSVRLNAQEPSSPEARAVAYLSAEVPRWRREHPCYSCHNNGDGTRALIAASRRGLMDAASLGDAAGWLRTPERWAQNSDDGGVKDLPLARIQFASALQLLVEAGQAEGAALGRAAVLVAADQRPDGSWPISASAAIGSPAGYGTPLATAVARALLARAGGPEARTAVERADRWFRASNAESVIDASAVLLGIERAADSEAAVRRRVSLRLLKQGQGRDGGWGPFVSSPSEPFDTALAMLALAPLRDRPELATPAYSVAELNDAILRARGYLLQQQNEDGSWTETTRPAQQESYAQRISTTGWATLALLASTP